MEDNFESTNIHMKWLENIYNELRLIQDMERIAREGCRNLMEYFEIPFDMQKLIIPDVRYKNLRFMVMEIDILITNLSHVLGEKYTKYKDRLKPINNIINNRRLFLKEVKQNNKLVNIQVLDFLEQSINYVLLIKSDIIKDIGHILYLPEEKKKTW